LQKNNSKTMQKITLGKKYINKLLKAKEKQRHSFRTLAKELNISTSTVTNVLTGKTVALKSAQKVCKELGYKLEVITKIKMDELDK